jgi:hypothetical protein
MVGRDKHSSLLRKSVNYGQKQFYNIGPSGWFRILDPEIVNRVFYHCATGGGGGAQQFSDEMFFGKNMLRMKSRAPKKKFFPIFFPARKRMKTMLPFSRIQCYKTVLFRNLQIFVIS